MLFRTSVLAFVAVSLSLFSSTSTTMFVVHGFTTTTPLPPVAATTAARQGSNKLQHILLPPLQSAAVSSLEQQASENNGGSGGLLRHLLIHKDNKEDDDVDKDIHPVVGAYGDWRAYLDDDDTGLVYYYNIQTGGSQWHAPAHFPKITLTTLEKRKSASKQDTFNEELLLEASAVNKKQDEDQNGSFFWPSFLQKTIQELPQHAARAASELSLLLKDDDDDDDEYYPEAIVCEGDWCAYSDDEAGGGKSNTQVYYFNSESGVSQWHPPTTTFPNVNDVSQQLLSSAASSDKNKKQQDELLAVHGDWKAYYDTSDTCLVYYCNDKMGTAQWEPPTSDFPIPTLSQEQLARTRAKRDQLRYWNRKTKNTNGIMTEAFTGIASIVIKFLDALFELAELLYGLAQETVQDVVMSSSTDHNNGIQKLLLSPPPTPLSSAAGGFNILVDWVQDALPTLHQQQHRDNDGLETLLGTHVVAATSPPSHHSDSSRSQQLDQKRKLDHEHRQVNLRKKYRKVHENRSPTISLSAMKRKGSRDWLSFLDD